MKTLTNKTEIKKLMELFADKTGCSAQFNGCPCNTCFHAIEDLDFRHIVWLLLLGIRGDYDSEEILNAIKEELNNG